MVEHIQRKQDFIETDRSLTSGDNISPLGSEAEVGQRVLEAGTRLDYARVGALATVGWADVPVYRKPRVSIIATGDEIVPLDVPPADHQIRNSNSYSLRAQVLRAGALVAYSTVALDTLEALRAVLNRAFSTDLILFSGGVSAGKYDLVEKVLAEFGAEFFFTRVLIQPGQPAVFGRAHKTLFFGLPGNPASTMVTFELFARLALELLSGEKDPQLPLFQATLSQRFCHKKGLTRFLPATLKNGSLTPVRWQGSGDIFAMARANAFLVAEPDRECWETGDLMRVLAR
jgi:molybdopterin molybdotransferase